MPPQGSFPDYGYDPTFDVGLEFPPPLTEADNPHSANVDVMCLPPVGAQGTPQHPGSPATCCAWASTYGLATFTAAKRTKSPPGNDNDLIASPAYIYLQVRQQQEQKTQKPTPPCGGSSYNYYFQILAQGTPNLTAAPYFPDCTQLTQAYQGKQIPPDSRFIMGAVSHVKTSDVFRLKQLLASNCAIAYATKLYTDWGKYAGTPIPYVGNGIIAAGPKGPVGHCMLIIGYDDGIGGFLLQNSEGAGWGEQGLVWMAYATFSSLAQIPAFYYSED
jgi:hypothetical protein